MQNVFGWKLQIGQFFKQTKHTLLCAAFILEDAEAVSPTVQAKNTIIKISWTEYQVFDLIKMGENILKRFYLMNYFLFFYVVFDNRKTLPFVLSDGKLPSPTTTPNFIWSVLSYSKINLFAEFMHLSYVPFPLILLYLCDLEWQTVECMYFFLIFCWHTFAKLVPHI